MRARNILKMGWFTLGAHLFGSKAPLNVMLSLTNRCTSRCGYCAIPDRRQRELSRDEVLRLIDELSAMGCQRLGLWGGEPLIRDDAEEIVSYAHDKSIFVTMDSNGFLIPKKRGILDNLDHLVLALDGKEEEHDLNRGKGSFLKVMDAIDIASGRLPLWTITVLTSNNLNSIDFILQQAEKYGFMATFQLPHHNTALSGGNAGFLAADGEYRKAINRLVKAKANGAAVANSLAYLKRILSWPDYGCAVLERKVGNLRCWAGRLFCNVDTDGSLYPCSLLVDKIKAPSFLALGFKKAFYSMPRVNCRSCLASCFTEYNYLFSLDARVIREWLSSMSRSKRMICRKKIFL